MVYILMLDHFIQSGNVAAFSDFFVGNVIKITDGIFFIFYSYVSVLQLLYDYFIVYDLIFYLIDFIKIMQYLMNGFLINFKTCIKGLSC